MTTMMMNSSTPTIIHSLLVPSLLLCLFLGDLQECNSYSILESRQQQQQHRLWIQQQSSHHHQMLQQQLSHFRRDGSITKMMKSHISSNSNDDMIESIPLESKSSNHLIDRSRRDMLSLITSFATIAISTSNTLMCNAEDVIVEGNNYSVNENLTTQLFNLDGSLKDTDQVVVAQERTITLPPIKSSSQMMVWVDGIPSSSSSSNDNLISSNSNDPNTYDVASSSILQYNVPMKWDTNYIDSTTKERACTRVSTYRMPYQPKGSRSDDTVTKGKRRSASSNSINNLQVSDIVSAFPQDSIIRQTLLGADIVGGTVRRGSSSSSSSSRATDTTTAENDASTKRNYSEFDLAVAPTTCTGGENEDLRLGFCPYDRIFLISATTTTTTTTTTSATTTTNTENDINNVGQNPSDYISILIVESTRSEWQRANADLRRVRSSFMVG